MFQNAGSDAGVEKLSTHTMRHSYGAWLDAVGTPIAVQQKLTRHASITTTMNIYGDMVTDEMAEAHSILADNKLAEKAGWDNAILAIELQHLTSIDLGFDVLTYRL